jgi:hypothetical protein
VRLIARTCRTSLVTSLLTPPPTRSNNTLTHSLNATSYTLKQHTLYPSHCLTPHDTLTHCHSPSMSLPHRRWATSSSIPTQRQLPAQSSYMLCAPQRPLMGDKNLQGRKGPAGRRLMQGKSEEYTSTRRVSVLSLSYASSDCALYDLIQCILTF